MNHFANLALSAVAIIPIPIRPYLAIVVIIVCLLILGLICSMLKNNKGNIGKQFVMMSFLLSVIIVLGFGVDTLKEIFQVNDYFLAVLKLSVSDADEQDLEIALDSASTDEKKLLAFDIFSRSRPNQALTYLQANNSKLPQSILDRESRVLAFKAARNARGTKPKIVLDNPKTLEGLLHLGSEDPQVARFLQQGKFDTSKFSETQLNEILRKQGARLEGGGIRIKK